MKNPKLIDEAWIDEQIQYVGTPNNKYDDALLHVMNLVKSKLQPLPTPTKTNVDKIRDGEMAIEDDDVEALINCMRFCFNSLFWPNGMFKFYFACRTNSLGWDCLNITTLPIIKASELIKEIEGVSEPAPEWQPKFWDCNKTETNQWYDAKEYLPIVDEFEDYCSVIAVIDGESLTGVVYNRKLNHFQSCFDTTNNSPLNVTHWMHIPKPPKITKLPTLTLAEAEAKLGVKIVT